MSSDTSATKRNRLFVHLALGCIVIALAYLGYYGLYGRFYEYTNDAYVNGNQVILTPQVPGIVTAITADDTDFILRGRPLIYLDPTNAQIDLDLKKAELNNTVRRVIQMFERVQELEAEIVLKEALFIRAEQDLNHRALLVDEGGVSLEEFEHMMAAAEASLADLEKTEHAYIGALAQVQNTTVTTHPQVIEAQEKLKMAYVNLQRCTLLAPVTGLVAKRNAQVGQQVRVGEPLLAIVPLDQMWVDANFKEIQLSKMRIGQPVEVRSDLFGSDVPFRGTVVGIGAGTGSIFSVLPPQNATGNWIKIVQRIPVRIALLPSEIQRHPLRLGMSMETTVDLHNTHLPEIPVKKAERPMYETDVFSSQEKGVKQLIDQIMEEAQRGSTWAPPL